MKYRKFGRLDWNISEIGYGMWGMGGQWKGGTDEESIEALIYANQNGCNFFDTAWIYGNGHSERLFREALSERHNKGNLFVATKIPPKNLKWPGSSNDDILEVFPKEHILEYCKKSIENLGVDYIDLLQLHVWDDSWTDSDEWKQAIQDLKDENLIKGFGISINKWESENILKALTTDLIDSVQCVYNIFEQAPEDKLFPICKEKNIAIIARVPFDEGSLTGSYSRDTVFEKDDWRSKFFNKRMLNESLDRIEKIRSIIPSSLTLSEIALKFILTNDAVSVVIPGMRRKKHVESNFKVSDLLKLDDELYLKLKQFRWDRDPKEFSA